MNLSPEQKKKFDLGVVENLLEKHGLMDAKLKKRIKDKKEKK